MYTPTNRMCGLEQNTKSDQKSWNLQITNDEHFKFRY